jgi:hypothetical protein
MENTMTDVPEWDRPRPAYWPNHAEDALVKELVDACIRGDGYDALYQQFCDDRDRDGNWRRAMFALLELHVATAIGTQGRELAAARSAADMGLAHEQALKEADLS